MNEFMRAYIVAALWSSTDHDDHDRPLDDNFGPDDLSPELLKQMEADCQKFESNHSHLWADAPDGEYTADARAGHDFWLTRNGHGAGFWDSPEVYGQKNADKLTEAAKKFGEYNLLWVQDGKIHGD